MVKSLRLFRIQDMFYIAEQSSNLNISNQIFAAYRFCGLGDWWYLSNNNQGHAVRLA